MDAKTLYKQKDRLVRGITNKGDFKIAVVKTTHVVREVSRRHNLSLLNKVILGRALTGVALLASEMKGEERAQLRIESNGPIGMLVAEANSVGEIRGYVQNPQADLPPEELGENLGAGLGNGILYYSKTLYNHAKPRTSTIELQKGDVTQDLAFLLYQSEQVPSGIKLDVGIDEEGEISSAGGVLVQKLPSASDTRIEEIQENLENMQPLNKILAKGKYVDRIMQDALQPFEVRELNRYPVDFFCRCSKKRFKNALSLISYEELKEMTEEPQELVCHYCNEHYTISSMEIDEIAEKAKAKLN